VTNAAEDLANRFRAGYAESVDEGLAAPVSFLADEVELVRGQPDDGVKSGAALAARYASEGATLRQQMPDFTISDVVITTEGDDRVVVEGRTRWTAPTGPVDRAFHLEYTLRDDRIVHIFSSAPARAAMDPSDVLSLHQSLSNWGRWGDDDQLGTLNFITPEVTVSAATTVQAGHRVSCSRPLPTKPALDNPSPVLHHMTGTFVEGHGGDFFAISSHGFTTTHIDALCHVFHEGKLYNGYSAETVTPHGAMQLGLHHMQSGIATRGVLLDIAAVRGVEALEPGEPIFPEDLEAAEDAGGFKVQSGDALLIRTGRWRWRELHGPWRLGERAAGLDASCLSWIHQRQVSILGCDGFSDVMPSRIASAPKVGGSSDVGGVDLTKLGLMLPIHSVSIVAMGMPLLDNLELEELAAVCTANNRWAFFFLAAPLVLENGTGSPLNPIAIL